MSGAPVTLKTIAAELGVSVTTVARALKDGDRISAETVQRVRDAADRLGYVRNLEGAKLRTGRSLVIMAFLSFSTEEEVGDSGSVGLLNGIHQRLAGTDYAVRGVPVMPGQAALDQLRAVVRGRLADGVILDHIEAEDARIDFLLKAGLPFVTYGRTATPEQHPWFDIDNEQAAFQGTDALIRAGYRRIATIEGDRRFTFVQQRRQGHRRALASHGISPDPALEICSEIAADTARRNAGLLLDQGADAFHCVNELAFLGALAGVRDRLGARADRIGFALRAGTKLAEYVATDSFVTYHERRQAGMRLADLVLRRIDGVPISACQELQETSLVAVKAHSGHGRD
ncbi:MAG: LacI family transcriptional regulator [Paracoccus denitrificans]|uniref:LacI family transcriptional regulator n=1 Tax=Paracoccus denitrificans TaxID=266 RepID=A0A533I3B2_PARDE|nr:MAG: LacI family transcriptional regulator [Paracoccus denitrificans]